MNTDTSGEKPLILTLAQILKLTETRLYGFQKQKKAGQKNTVPAISNEGEITDPQLLDDLIENWEKEKIRLEKVIAWAEERKPGSARRENGEQLIEEYENLFGKD